MLGADKQYLYDWHNFYLILDRIHTPGAFPQTSPLDLHIALGHFRASISPNPSR